MPMPERTSLQKTLRPEYIARDLETVQRLFMWDIGFDFAAEATARCQQALERGEDFNILDLGCGVGSCLEDLLTRLKAFMSGRKDQIRGIGVDLNPLPSEMPQHLLGPTGVPSAHFIAADVCDLPIAGNSINFGYGVGTLIYVGDSLKALEEVQRVLKPGGIFLFDANAQDLSVSPPFEQILQQTPEATQEFRYMPSPYVAHSGFVICTKLPNSSFKGFPFKAERILTRPEAFGEVRGDYRDYFKNAIYRAIDN